MASAFSELEAGAKFEVTRDRTQYLTATQHLESAASYYAKAGLESATEYAKATQRLFDAYMYVDDAKKERDAEKKAKYYIMAERVLEMSVASYLKAKYHEKAMRCKGFWKILERRDNWLCL